MTTTHNRDYEVMQNVVQILLDSALNKKEYSFRSDRVQSTYRELAEVLSKEEIFNKLGKPYDRNSLKQLVHRMTNRPDELKQLTPDWTVFEQYQSKFPAAYKPKRTEDREESKSNCLVCGVLMRDTLRRTCSSGCSSFYRQHHNLPHDDRYASSFHEIEDKENIQ